jgi:hypothetical protein
MQALSNKRNVLCLAQEQQHESPLIPIDSSSIGHLGLPEFAGSATDDFANDPDDHNHGNELDCHVEVRNKETAEATEAPGESGQGAGEVSQAPSGRSQEPIGRQEGAE